MTEPNEKYMRAAFEAELRRREPEARIVASGEGYLGVFTEFDWQMWKAAWKAGANSQRPQRITINEWWEKIGAEFLADEYPVYAPKDQAQMILDVQMMTFPNGFVIVDNGCAEICGETDTNGVPLCCKNTRR